MSDPCKAAMCQRLGGCAGHAPRMSLQDWNRVRQFIYDLTDPDMYAFTVKDPEVRRRALEIKSLFDWKW